MAIFKCKMCGGTLEFNPGDTVAVCDSCGTKQTLPRLDGDKKANLYDRANHFRRNNEYDKALSIYEQILAEDSTDAEAYWSLVLCRYGIEYVEDPVTGKRIPTVNRAQFTSVFDDDNYKSALRCADAAQKEIYKAEAKAINEIQKGILAISQKEEPFDVFICYKETDDNGKRTMDSVLANDLYHQLTQEGFKVFFSRITLEDKLGTEYEPYIFAALNSAKVMVVLGTKPEYFSAVWVRNEWSRFLALIKSGEQKVLIPAYRDMSPYDLPEEFSHLQALDMSRLGFMQDLIRGIKKILGAEAVAGAANTTSPLLRRASLFLENREWKNAESYCERILDQEPENAQAYVCKLMAELHVRKREELVNCSEPIDGSKNYGKAMRFGDEALRTELENARLTRFYNDAVKTMSAAGDECAYKSAAEKFRSLTGFKDADALAEQCEEKAENIRKDKIYASAKSYEDGTVYGYERAADIYQQIEGWKDADERRLAAEHKAEELRIAEEKAAKKRKKILAIATPIVCACIAFVILLTQVIIPRQKYNKAMSLIAAGEYDSAYTILEEIGNDEAIAASKYDRAMERIDAQDYETAYMLLDDLDYKDSKEKQENIKPQYYREILMKANVGDTVSFGSYEQDNDISNGKEDVEWLVLEVKDGKVLLISKYALDCQQYNTSYTKVTWETCTLRKWLNNGFVNAAFSDNEKAMISTVTVSADKNPEYSTNPGSATTDKVFLLSINEAEKYFSSDEARKCAPTAYAKAQGAYTSNGTCWWWLRSPGDDQLGAALVDSVGDVYYNGNYVNIDGDCVRPALWINLDAE
mgnify:CR=1 FL=1